ncbi:hypothetical protein AAC387_Pa05g3475 [Persea americana]
MRRKAAVDRALREPRARRRPCFLVYTKALRLDGRIRSKNRVSYGDNTWVLTVESSNSYSRYVADIGLEVNEANWEDKHINLIKDLAYEGVIVLVGEDKAGVERSFEDRQYLCGTWVRVRRGLSIKSLVYANQGDT